MDENKQLNELNIRGMMATYYLGVGPRDVGNTLSFLGVPGGLIFHNVFYDNMDLFTAIMHKELEVIVEEELQKEIESTITYELTKDYSPDEIKEYIKKLLLIHH